MIPFACYVNGLRLDGRAWFADSGELQVEIPWCLSRQLDVGQRDTVYRAALRALGEQ